MDVEVSGKVEAHTSFTNVYYDDFIEHDDYNKFNSVLFMKPYIINHLCTSWGFTVCTAYSLHTVLCWGESYWQSG